MGLFQNHMMAAAAAATADTTYSITNSCRFDGDSILKITPGSDGDRNTWTFSTWFKRAGISTGTALTTIQNIFGGGSLAGTYDCDLYIGSYDTPENGMKVAIKDASDIAKLSRTFRDPSAWMHVVWRMDTTQGTEADRMRIYINGDLITAYDDITYPDEDEDLDIPRSGYQISLGAASDVSGYPDGRFFFDGYLAETHFVDGSSLGPDSFGKTNDEGVWIPIKTSGITYGTHGWFMDYQSSGDLGNDVSGNNNDSTSNNLAAANQMSDTPTNNFCTINPLNSNTDVLTLADGNLYSSYAGGAYQAYGSGTIGMNSGKWYWEGTCSLPSGSGTWGIGIFKATGKIKGNEATNNTFNSADSYIYFYSGLKYNGSATGVSYGNSYTNGDVISVAFDADNGTLTFYKNNSSEGEAYSGLTSGPYLPSFTNYSGGAWTFNFGQSDFAYTPPADHEALSTANLAAPTVTDPSTNFQTELYTGNGSTQSITFSGNSDMQPDIVWAKCRSDADAHVFQDAARGVGLALFWSGSDTEDAVTDAVTAFNSDGFALGDGSELSSGTINTSSRTYVSWNWAAGNSGSSNTDGSINTTTTYVDTTAGISISTYTGTGDADETVGHGLGVTPAAVMLFPRSNGDHHLVNSWETGVSAYTEKTYLDRVDDAFTSSSNQLTAASSTTFTLGSDAGLNGDGRTYLAYAFAEIEGFSRFGTYTGNGDADGPFVWCGFTPKMVMMRADRGGEDWIIFDTARNTYNVATDYLYPNSAEAEATSATYLIDFLSNGFKIRGTEGRINRSGVNIIFAAFAEYPFGGDGVAPAIAR